MRMRAPDSVCSPAEGMAHGRCALLEVNGEEILLSVLALVVVHRDGGGGGGVGSRAWMCCGARAAARRVKRDHEKAILSAHSRRAWGVS